MNLILINCVIFLITLNIAACHKSHKSHKEWKKYLSDYDKNYNKEDEPMRRKLWEATKKKIEKHNKGYKRGYYNYSMGLNHMSDWTKEEYRKHKCLHGLNVKAEDNYKWVDKCDKNCFNKLPKNVDWRSKKAVTPIKNQGQCGACWAFGTVGALEAHNAIKTGHLVDLSEQQLVDCSRKYGTKGCEGGNAINAMNYVIANKGLSTEKGYPYKEKDGSCKKQLGKQYAAVRSFKTLKRGDERNLQVVVARHGPVVVAIFASENIFLYKHGVFHDDSCSGNKADHIVLVVGYGVEKGVPYWLIKNSWGTSHGEKGYVKLIRNKNNQCSVASFGVVPM